MEIPENWTPTFFRNIGLFYGGGTPSTMNSEYWNGPIQWTTSKRLGDPPYLDSGERTISERALKESSTTLIPAGNLLIGTRVGTGKIVVNRIDIAISQDLTGIVVDKSKYLPEFVLYQVRAQRLQECFQKQKRGVTIQGVSRDDLKEFALYIPSHPEQKKIASILLKIQKAIEIQDSIIEKTRELKKSTLRRVFIHGLRGERLKEKEIGPMPESWVVAKVGSYCQKPEYGLTESAVAEEIGPKFLRITDITENGVDWDAVPYCRCPQDLFPKYALKENDILFARIGATTGKSHIVKNPPPAVFASYLIRLRPLNDVVPDYLYYFFNSEAYWYQVNANKKNNLKYGVNSSILSDIIFPLPSKSEQDEIVRIIHTIDQKIYLHTTKKSALQDLFKTMLNKLMTGEIRVKELDIDVSEVSA